MLILTGTAPINGFGNTLDNTITGNDADNSLFAGIGNDSLYGGGGNDILYGEIGNDILYGGGGNDYLDGQDGDDAMNGGNGDDLYFVNSTGDTVTEESVTGGYDTVNSSVTFALGPNLEVLILTGAAPISGHGNSLNNAITGNGVDNFLHGWDGDDTLYGGGGDDSPFGPIGNDSLDGGTGNDFLRGDTGDDILNGGANDDMLYGGMGNDTLTGGDNADKFVFDTPLGPANVDVITDFYWAEGDKIYLDRDIFTVLGSYTGTLSDANFWKSNSGMPVGSDDYFLYYTDSNSLYYDQDGSGGAYAPVKFATVNFHVSEDNLYAEDFTIIA
ncbi:MAG: calcium-binding protein [Desulfoprunum sp.]|uniref:calcium-binding protein n=1 Tax=Desulfoprunum sp. TaxID=2020866 RepID=UPI003C70ABDD